MTAVAFHGQSIPSTTHSQQIFIAVRVLHTIVSSPWICLVSNRPAFTSYSVLGVRACIYFHPLQPAALKTCRLLPAATPRGDLCTSSGIATQVQNSVQCRARVPASEATRARLVRDAKGVIFTSTRDLNIFSTLELTLQPN